MKNVICLDIGGSNFRVARINQNYEFEKVEIEHTIHGNKDQFCEQVVRLIRKLINTETMAISAGVPGRVNPVNGYIYALPNVGVNEFFLSTELNKHFNVPIFIRNDAEMAVMAESNIGAGKKYKSCYFITISTGLGGALSIDKKIFASSAEIGHTLTKYGTSYYEFEQIASGSGIVKLARLNGLKLDQARDLFELVKNGDKKAEEILNDWVKIMKSFLNFIYNTFRPEIICITGGVMKSKDLFFSSLQDSLKVPIVECQTGENAGLIGAAVYAFKNIA